MLLLIASCHHHVLLLLIKEVASVAPVKHTHAVELGLGTVTSLNELQIAEAIASWLEWYGIGVHGHHVSTCRLCNRSVLRDATLKGSRVVHEESWLRSSFLAMSL